MATCQPSSGSTISGASRLGLLTAVETANASVRSARASFLDGSTDSIVIDV
jgi:hypothetical protein